MMETNFADWIEKAAFPWLADICLQATLVFAAALLLVRLGRRSWSASKRHTILAASLFSVPLLIVASLWAPGWGMTSPSAQGTSDGVRVRSVAQNADGSAAAGKAPSGNEAQASVTLATPGQSALSSRLKSAGFVVWFGGISSCAVLVLLSAWRLRQLRLAAKPLRSGRRVEVMDSLRNELGIAEQRSLSLLVAADESMPMTWGLRNAVILLPASSADWDEDRLRLVLRHEMAHIARADSAVSLGGFLCAAMMWFNPLAWLSCQQLWRLREHACDDRVLTACEADPISYAEELVEVIKGLGPMRPPMGMPAVAMAMGMARPGKRALSERVGAVLEDGRERSGFGASIRRVALPLWLLSVVVLAGLSACRDTSEEGETAIRDDWSRRIFVLTDEQWRRLSGGDDLLGQAPGPVDPFAAVPAERPTVPKPVSMEQLQAAAVAVRSRLIEEGIEFDFKTAAEADIAISLNDPRTLVVVGDEALQNQVASLLSGYSDESQVRIRAHVFRVPSDFDYAGGLDAVKGDAATGALTGIVDADVAKGLLERVENTKGAEVLARPIVVTGNATEATIEVGREFIYPTEYDPPEIPNEMAPQSGSESGVFPVTPANPAAFETRNIGLQLRFLPILQKDGKLSLDLRLEQINFEGFINYGSPINAAYENEKSGKRDAVVLTENRIVMPVFNSSVYESKIAIQPEDWIIIGGLGESEDYSVEDVEIDAITGIRKPVKYTVTVKTMLFFAIQADLIE